MNKGTKFKFGTYDKDGRVCRKCNTYKLWDEYHVHRLCTFGRNTICKVCRVPSSRANYANKVHEKRILERAKSRATAKGLDFNLTIEDIIIPEICPVLGTPMANASLDRISSDGGYTKDNVRVISSRANTLKNNARIWELEKILEDLKKIEANYGN